MFDQFFPDEYMESTYSIPFEKLYQEDTYEKVLLEYLNSSDYSELGYEHLLVYFVCSDV